MKFVVIAVVVFGLGASFAAYWLNKADPVGIESPKDSGQVQESSDPTGNDSKDEVTEEGTAGADQQQADSERNKPGRAAASVSLEVRQYLNLISPEDRAKTRLALRRLNELDERFNGDLAKILLAMNQEFNRLLETYRATKLTGAEKESLREELEKQAWVQNQVIVLLGYRSGPEIRDALIQASRNTPTESLVQSTLLTSLASQGPSKVSRQYFLELVQDPEATFYQKDGAIGYLAEHAQSSEAPILEELLSKTDDPRVLGAGLIWASQIQSREKVMELVDRHLQNNGGDRETVKRALFALAEVATIEEFDRTVSGKPLSKWDVESARRAVQFREGTASEKERLLPAMLDSHYAVEHLNAFRYLLEESRTDIVTPLALADDHHSDGTKHRTVRPKYRRLARMLGYRLSISNDTIEIEEIDR